MKKSLSRTAFLGCHLLGYPICFEKSLFFSLKLGIRPEKGSP